MSARSPSPILGLLLVAAFLLPSPALAAPAPETPPATRLAQVVADWWAELTRPVERLFEANRSTIDPNGVPSTATEDPTDGNEHRGTIDPNG